MNHRLRAGGLIYGAVSLALCTGIAAGGYSCAAREAQEPDLPVPTAPAPVLAIPTVEPAITAADLWSDARRRRRSLLLAFGAMTAAA